MMTAPSTRDLNEAQVILVRRPPAAADADEDSPRACSEVAATSATRDAIMRLGSK